jgi:hypothetical protein
VTAHQRDNTRGVPQSTRESAISVCKQQVAPVNGEGNGDINVLVSVK